MNDHFFLNYYCMFFLLNKIHYWFKLNKKKSFYYRAIEPQLRNIWSVCHRDETNATQLLLWVTSSWSSVMGLMARTINIMLLPASRFQVDAFAFYDTSYLSIASYKWFILSFHPKGKSYHMITLLGLDAERVNHRSCTHLFDLHHCRKTPFAHQAAPKLLHFQS